MDPLANPADGSAPAGQDGDAAGVLAALLSNPDALVAAMGEEGRLVPVPDSVPLRGQRVFTGSTAIELVINDDQPKVIDGWVRSQTEPIVRLKARFVTDPDHEGTLHFLDVSEQHGVRVIVVETSNAELLLDSASLAVEAPTGIAHIKRDAASVFLEVDDATTAILGWRRDQLLGRRTLDLVHPDDRNRAIDGWFVTRSGADETRSRIRLRRPDGHHVWVEISNENRLDDADDPCVLSQLVDISDEMAALEALHDRERLLHRLAETLPIGICHLRPDGQVVHANPLLVTFLGPIDSLDALVASIAVHDRPSVQAAVAQALRGHPRELVVGVVDGLDERRCELTLRAMTAESGGIDGVVVCTSDVTDRNRLRSELEHRASHDALSGCLNRAATLVALEQARCEHQHLAVAYIDLDGFKSINDRLGHAAGDEVLRVAASRVRGVIRGEDRLGRMGGDEFVVVCPQGQGPFDPEELVTRLTDAITGDVTFAGHTIPLRASVGVAISSGSELGTEALLGRADAAMYEVKRQRRRSAQRLHVVPRPMSS